MNVTRASKLENVPYEEFAKFVNDRLISMENSLAKMSLVFSNYNKKMSSLRNATDDLAILLHEYASEEKINISMKGHILQFSELLASVGDCRDIEVKQLDSQILKDLCHYETLCHNAKAEVKNILSLKEKELNMHKQLQKLRNRNPYKREDIIRAEASLSTAMNSISRSLKELEEHINQFEEKKIQDMKSFLLKFITIELAHHSNAIQLFTESFNEIKKIDISSDLHEFELIMKRSLEENSQKRTISICKHQYSPALSNSINYTKNDDTNSQSNKKYETKLLNTSVEASQTDTDYSSSESYQVTGNDESANT